MFAVRLSYICPKYQEVLAIAILVLIILLITGLLLFAPIRVQINSWQDQYRFEWLWLVSLSLVPTDDFLVLRVHIPFKDFEIDPLSVRTRSTRKKDKVRETHKSSGVSWATMKKFGSVLVDFLRAFKVRHFRMVYNTGNYLLTAQLQPVFQLLRHYGVNAEASFYGDSGVEFEGSNRAFYLVRQSFNVFVLNRNL